MGGRLPDMDDTKRAKEIIEAVIYINIASVTESGMPWNMPVYATYDEDYNFFWLSWRESQHSKNIRANPDVFITIYDSTQQEGTGEGVYIKARAEEVNDPGEIERENSTWLQPGWSLSIKASLAAGKRR